MVHLQKFQDQYGDKGLQVFVISMHPELEEARKLTTELRVTYPVFNGYKSDLGKTYAFG